MANETAEPMDTNSENDEDVCWICLGESEAGDQLWRPCSCPRLVHAKCMARWQLQCSGKSEEVTCKFCNDELPNWRHTLFQEMGLMESGEASPENSPSSSTRTSESENGTPAVMGDIIVKFNNMSFRCKVRTGPEGLADFMNQIRQRCAIPEEKMASLNLTYRCKDPRSGSPMTLEGVNESAFDAAVLCSAVQDKMKHSNSAEGSSQERETRHSEHPPVSDAPTSAGAGRRVSSVFMSALRNFTARHSM